MWGILHNAALLLTSKPVNIKVQAHLSGVNSVLVTPVRQFVGCPALEWVMGAICGMYRFDGLWFMRADVIFHYIGQSTVLI